MECWGSDYSGQSTPPSGSFLSVSGGASHTCAIANSGSIECWGDDKYNINIFLSRDPTEVLRIRFFDGFVSGLGNARDQAGLWQSSILSVWMWLNGALAIYCLFLALGLELPFLPSVCQNGMSHIRGIVQFQLVIVSHKLDMIPFQQEYQEDRTLNHSSSSSSMNMSS